MYACLSRHHAKLQFGLRMTVAALAAYAAGEALGLAQTYWAVLSAVIVIQGSTGGSLRAGINRLIGTVGGAVWGAAVSLLIPHTGVASLGVAMLAAVAPLAVVTGFRPDYRVAPITAIIVLMATVLMRADPVSSALSRFAEICLGSAIAVAVALFILPARAHRLLARAASAAVSEMARIVAMLGGAPGAGVDMQALFEVQKRLRVAVAAAETRADEADVERANRLSEGPDPEPLVRTLRRLRHDLAMLARALAAPIAPPARELLAPPLAALLGAIHSWLTATAQALADGRKAPALDTVQASVRDYKAVMASAGEEALIYKAGGGIHRIFALLFVFEEMLPNLQDLADRTAELARAGNGREEPAAPGPV